MRRQVRPESWDVTHIRFGLDATAGLRVEHDVVERDDTAVAYEWAVGQEVPQRPFVGVITVDEENVQPLAAEDAFHAPKRARRERGPVDEAQSQVWAAEVAQLAFE